MPVDKQVLLRYQVLNKCFRNRYREYTIDDLVDECNKALRRADKTDVSKRTVQNDINQLEVDFHIVLDENLRQGRKRLYRYVDTSYSLPLYRMNDEERNKIESAIYVLKQFEGEPIYDWATTILMQIEGGLFDGESSPVVSFQSNLDLKGLAHFSRLLQAILTKRVLKIRYTPFGKSQITSTVYPYYLKEYNDRWYLIAQAKGYETFAHYALDRIDDFEEVAIPYKEAESDFEEYFDDVIGVTVPEMDSEDIFLRINKPRFEYIRTKPLHLTQSTIEENDEFGVIKINVKVNKELEALVLSYGNDIEVLSPVTFREQIINKIHSMNQKYMSDAENMHT
ncbi:Predicted DNA-binding transcriptional regulator YafY, contains an HTH and WYL domains [Xylanibacter ruminicola]|uniref:Predicted DNA-binding transcriptional regulator YafY, contains an HTH and WYL domains n=1 Tax=Xylanibacter ruminicola TaxID=839 RepID=A0A1M7CTJ6_XYLRU|nr:WYL domain-containing protein [Xylanibacter ruminicola]SHL70554.1 Predicted DNA-binding transcriptional regulator YafY, contains an HTH and WYL domains [Xylanibacter ruminicola]